MVMHLVMSVKKENRENIIKEYPMPKLKFKW